MSTNPVTSRTVRESARSCASIRGSRDQKKKYRPAEAVAAAVKKTAAAFLRPRINNQVEPATIAATQVNLKLAERPAHNPASSAAHRDLESSRRTAAKLKRIAMKSPRRCRAHSPAGPKDRARNTAHSAAGHPGMICLTMDASKIKLSTYAVNAAKRGPKKILS